MHTQTATIGPANGTSESIGAPRRSRALAVRRGFLIAAPVLAGLFAVIGAYADPAAGIAGIRLYEIYTDNPGPLQFKSLGFHWAYAFWTVPAFMAAAYVRGRGAWLANVAAFLGFAGMTTLPGMLFSDWYDSAIGQVHGGAEAVQAVQDQMTQTMWGIAWFTVPGMLGLLLALPLATIALWRAGVVRWWALVAVLAGQAAFLFSSVMWWGCAITTVCFAVFSYALAQGTRDRTEI
jgi:hypothetical protein